MPNVRGAPRRSLVVDDETWDRFGRAAERLGYTGRSQLLRTTAAMVADAALALPAVANDPQTYAIHVRVQPIRVDLTRGATRGTDDGA